MKYDILNDLAIISFINRTIIAMKMHYLNRRVEEYVL